MLLTVRNILGGLFNKIKVCLVYLKLLVLFLRRIGVLYFYKCSDLSISQRAMAASSFFPQTLSSDHLEEVLDVSSGMECGAAFQGQIHLGDMSCGLKSHPGTPQNL